MTIAVVTTVAFVVVVLQYGMSLPLCGWAAVVCTSAAVVKHAATQEAVEALSNKNNKFLEPEERRSTGPKSRRKHMP